MVFEASGCCGFSGGGEGLMLDLLMGISHNCWGDKGVLISVQRLLCPMCHI